MEFLTTPDFSRWPNIASSSTQLRPPSTNPSAPEQSTNTARNPTNGATANPNQPNNVEANASQPPVSTTTPLPTTPLRPPVYPPPVDRAGIKNSFQSLFSPSSAPTPALYRQTPAHHTTAPGLTPFLGGLPTPGLVPPNSSLLTFPGGSPNAANQNGELSSPYLTAAAKEAVRREFMNMPTYVNTGVERLVPAKDFPRLASPESSPRGGAAMVPVQQVSPNSGDAKVPGRSNIRPSNPRTSQDGAVIKESPKTLGHAEEHKNTSKVAAVPTDSAAGNSTGPRPMTGVTSGMPVMSGAMGMPGGYFMAPPSAPHGVVMLGQHGQMVMAAPGMYAPPGMLMFAGQPGFPGGMIMGGAGGAGAMAGVKRPDVPVKTETAAERKSRIEHEKQELIREFKKKTREAALVRFRQKRRERRFGKLIRYDCRKKLADARPRVKGRFVRIKEDEEDDEKAQVVPG